MALERRITCSVAPCCPDLLSEPALHGLVPFVRGMYSEPSHQTWRDDSGNLHDIVQCEGGEQVGPLMPLLFSPGIHDALSEAKSTMGEEGHLLAFLDDVYVVSEPDRTRTGYDCSNVPDLVVTTSSELCLPTNPTNMPRGTTRAWLRSCMVSQVTGPNRTWHSALRRFP